MNIQTIRFYERRGLLSRPGRTPSGYRIFNPEEVRRIRFIKRAQELGFSLKEIKELLSLQAVPTSRCADVLQKTEEKLKQVDEKISDLHTIRGALEKLTVECRKKDKGKGPLRDCPILSALEEEGDENEKG